MCSLSYVHVYRIEYVSYRQGPYRIRIVSAADRIVPALIESLVKNYCNYLIKKKNNQPLKMVSINKQAQRALGRSPEEKVKGDSIAIYRGPLMLVEDL